MQQKINISAIINAPITKVWDFYTNPNHITQWNFAHPSWHCPSAINNLQVGGRYVARMEAKDGTFGFDFDAVYTALEIGKSFTYEFGGRFATAEFKEQKGSTEINISFDPETENPIEMQQQGWQAILNNFKTYTETNT